MNTIDTEPLRTESYLSRITRSRLGNALLVVHTLHQIRATFLRYPIDWMDPGNYRCLSDPEIYDGWSNCYHPSLGDVLYNLIHLPTWFAIGFIEWIAKPLWDGLWVIAANQLEIGLFVFIGAIQWLLIGFVAEALWRRRGRGSSLQPQPIPAPGRFAAIGSVGEASPDQSPIVPGDARDGAIEVGVGGAVATREAVGSKAVAWWVPVRVTRESR
jgi:hypothetical protein